MWDPSDETKARTKKQLNAGDFFRDAVLELAQQWPDRGFTTDRDEWIELIAPNSVEGSDESRRIAMATGWHDKTGAWRKTSTCGLFARGLLRRAGILKEDAPELYQPYRNGHAIADLMAIGNRAGAVHNGRELATLEVARPGDILYWHLPKTGEHIGILEKRIDTKRPNPTIRSIDAGQVDMFSQQCVLRRQRAARLGLGVGIVRVINVARLAPARRELVPHGGA